MANVNNWPIDFLPFHFKIQSFKTSYLCVYLRTSLEIDSILFASSQPWSSALWLHCVYVHCIHCTRVRLLSFGHHNSFRSRFCIWIFQFVFKFFGDFMWIYIFGCWQMTQSVGIIHSCIVCHSIALSFAFTSDMYESCNSPEAILRSQPKAFRWRIDCSFIHCNLIVCPYQVQSTKKRLILRSHEWTNFERRVLVFDRKWFNSNIFDQKWDNIDPRASYSNELSHIRLQRQRCGRMRKIK